MLKFLVLKAGVLNIYMGKPEILVWKLYGSGYSFLGGFRKQRQWFKEMQFLLIFLVFSAVLGVHCSG